MIAQGLSDKTGRRMGHMSMSGEQGSMAAFAALGVERRIYVHINNSNPALREDSPERAAVERAGWEIGLRRHGDPAVSAPMTPCRAGGGHPRGRRRALPRQAPVPSPAARRQARQGPGAGLGAQPLLLPVGRAAQGRRPDEPHARPRAAPRVGASHAATTTAMRAARKAASSAGWCSPTRWASTAPTSSPCRARCRPRASPSRPTSPSCASARCWRRWPPR